MLGILMVLVCAGTVDDGPEWGGFRGPNGTGHGRVKHLPDRLEPIDGFAWRTSVPAGYSSPVISGSLIFVTAVADERLLTMALDRRTGERVWIRAIPLEGEAPKRGSAAAATPATDGQVVVSVFHNGGVVAYDLAGKERWRYDPRPFLIPHGMSSSPVICGERVLVLIDQHVGSRLVALDRRTGEVRWEASRPHARAGYATPALHVTGDGAARVIVAGAYRISAYDVADGAEVWWVLGAGSLLKGVPVVHEGTCYVNASSKTQDELGGESLDASWAGLLAGRDRDEDGAISAEEWSEVSAQTAWETMDPDGDGFLIEAEYLALQHAMAAEGGLVAIRLGGVGDVSETHVTWWREGRLGLPDVASPLVVGNRLVLAKDGGILTLVDTETGTPESTRRIGLTGKVFASPVYGDGKLFVAGFDGQVAVLDGVDGEVVSLTDFEEPIVATPALAGRVVLIRTERALYAFRASDDG